MDALSGWVALALLPPALLASALALPRLRDKAVGLLPYAAWPALAAGILAPAGAVDLPLLLGVRLGVDEAGRVLLIAGALLWSAGGLLLLAERPDRAAFAAGRSALFLLLSMLGALGAVLALDRIGFYLCYAVSSLAAWGLIVTDETPFAKWAGRLYLGLVLFGELLMLAAFMAVELGYGGLGVGLLLFFGLGAKLGVLPLHVTLAPSYAAAPVWGAAMLGGPLLSIAMLGWMRFLPLADPGLTELSHSMVGAGLLAAFLGAVLGLLQAQAAAVLGYSSVSQMGLFTAVAGAALGEPRLWGAALPLLVLFALHHSLAKAALLVGLDAGRDAGSRRIVMAGLVLLSLSLAAAPLSGGALFKTWAEELLHARAATAAARVLLEALPFTSVATVVLMARFIWALRLRESVTGVGGGVFLVLTGAAFAGPWLHVVLVHPDPATMFDPSRLLKTLWPPVLGVALAAVGTAAALRLGWRLPVVPPGDWAVPAGRGLGVLRRRVRWPHRRGRVPGLSPTARAQRVELRLRRLRQVGVVYALLLIGFAAAVLVRL